MSYPVDVDAFIKAMNTIGYKQNRTMNQLFVWAKADRNSRQIIEKTRTIPSRTLYKLCTEFTTTPEYLGVDVSTPLRKRINEYAYEPVDDQKSERKAEQTALPIEPTSDLNDLLEIVRVLHTEVRNMHDELKANPKNVTPEDISDIGVLLNAIRNDRQKADRDLLQVLNRIESEDKKFHLEIGSKIVNAIMAAAPQLRLNEAISSGYAAIRKALKRDINGAIKGDLK